MRELALISLQSMSVLAFGARQLAVDLERLRWAERSAPATRIDVNTAAAELTFWRDGKVIARRAIAVGQPGWETPLPESAIYRLVATGHSHDPDP